MMARWIEIAPGKDMWVSFCLTSRLLQAWMSQAARGSIRFIERLRARHEPDIILFQNGVLSSFKWKVQAIFCSLCVC